MVWFDCPLYQKKCVLVVTLGRCYEGQFDNVKAAAEQAVSRLKNKSKLLLIRAEDSAQLANGEDSTLKDIYKISQHAVRAGWRRLVVFDTLTWRQITRETRFGESKIPSAVTLSLNHKGRERDPAATASPNFHIQRLKLEEALEVCRQHATSRFQMEINHDELWKPATSRATENLVRKGIVLRDPLSHPLDDETDAPANREQILQLLAETKPTLPIELRLEIMQYLGPHYSYRFNQLVKLDVDRGWQRPGKNLAIVSLIPLNDEELKEVQSFMGQELRRIFKQESEPSSPDLAPLHIAKWVPPTRGTRLDMLDIFAWMKRFNMYDDRGSRPSRGTFALFFDRIPKPGEQNTVLCVQSLNSGLNMTCRGEIRSYLVDALHARTAMENRPMAAPPLEKSGVAEISFDANSTFPPTPQPWGSRVSPMEIFHITVLFDCASISGEGIMAMRKELYSLGAFDNADALPTRHLNLPDIDFCDGAEDQQKCIHFASCDFDQFSLGLGSWYHRERVYRFMGRFRMDFVILADEEVLTDGIVMLVHHVDHWGLTCVKVRACDAYNAVWESRDVKTCITFDKWAIRNDDGSVLYQVTETMI